MYTRVKVKSRVCRIAALIACALLLLVSGHVAAGDAQSDQLGRPDQPSWNRDWVPAFALSGTYFVQSQKSSLSTECAQGGPESGIIARCGQAQAPIRDSGGVLQDPRRGVPTVHSGGPFALRDPASDSNLGVWPGVGIDFQLMSPHIYSQKGPRIFIGADIVAAFPPRRSIANEGALTAVEFPQDQPDPIRFPVQAISGLGTETVSEPRTFHYGAQIGLAFPFKLLNRTVRIKPSFAWLQYRLDVSGRLLAVVKDDVNGFWSPDRTKRTFGKNLRIIDLSERATRTVNAIGPGIEFELDSIRSGDFGISMFTSIHGYKVLSDRKIELASEVTFPDGTGPGGDGLLQDTYRARWSHEIKPWVYRLRVGIRFHYFGN